MDRANIEDDGALKVYRAASLEEAIDMAIAFQKEGRYDWFRGQVHPWPPHSSLLRLMTQEPQQWQERIKPRLMRLSEWMSRTPGLEDMAKAPDAFFAVAQHYGIPTHYIDFSTDPAVAGFFAADTKEPKPGTESCIYCLNTTDFLEVWDTLRGLADPMISTMQLVRNRVPNLWRLEAQQGVFLSVAGNWEVYYPMDRILFPFSDYPPYPPKEYVYPDRKSPLEILLDQFFDNEEKLLAEEWWAETVANLRAKGHAIETTTYERHPDLYPREIARSGEIKVHPSWDSADSWLTVSEEHFEEPREVTLVVDLELPAIKLRDRFALGIRRVLERHPELRGRMIRWALRAKADGPRTAVPADLSFGLEAIWDGVRQLPYSNEQVATALGNWVALHKLEVPGKFGWDERLGAASKLFGESIVVESGAADGSSSKGIASIQALVDAVRPDLPDLIATQYLDRISNLTFLLLNIYSPRLLFDFEKLRPVFVEQIVPSQIAHKPPHFFNLARLETLGVP